MGETDGYQYVFIFTIAKCCATKTLVLSVAAGVLVGCTNIPTLSISILPVYLATGFGSILEHPGPVCTRPIVNKVH